MCFLCGALPHTYQKVISIQYFVQNSAYWSRKGGKEVEKQIEQEAEGFDTAHGARSGEEHFAELDRKVMTSISACGAC